MDEGRIISSATIRCALVSADTAAREVNTSIMIRRHAWLRVSAFKPDVQHLLNLPFDGEHLFDPQVDQM